MTDVVFIHYQLPDGRRVGFGHPDAVADRIRALRAWNARHPVVYSEPCEYCDLHFKPGAEMDAHLSRHHRRERSRFKCDAVKP